MILIECLRMAVSAIKANKMRSFLTMLGIIIGISAVILITTIGDTMENTVNNVFDSMGTNYLFVGVETKGNSTESLSITEDDKLTDAMLDGLEKKYPNDYKVYKNDVLDSGVVCSMNNNDIYVNVSGVNSAYFDYSNTKIKKGRAINERDNEESRYSVVVSDVFAEKYNSGDGIIGKPIEFVSDSNEKYTFYVVGVYKSKKGTSNSDPIDLFIPNSVVRSLRNITNKKYDMTIVVWNSELGNESPEVPVKEYFDNVYKDNDRCGVYVDNMNEFTGTINTVMKVLTVAFTVIAAISLLVGGIGVMNIMLVSVVERTKEIGIRKAIGAKKRNILFQFVTEAIIICMIGGIIGILLGLGISVLLGIAANYAMKIFFVEQSEVLNIIVRPALKPMIVSLITSSAVGIIFGYYPAKNAAKLNPIEALRFDG